MHVLRTWFGSFEIDDKGDIIKQEIIPKEEILDRLLSEEYEWEQINELKTSFSDLAIKSGFVSSKDEYNELLHDIGIKLTEKKINASFTVDQVIIQAINTLDEIDDVLNLLCERLAGWGYLHSFDLTKNEDENHISNLKLRILELEETRLSIKIFIEKKMNEVAPNLANLAGPLLGARLISLASGIQNLSKMPSSTIQILGAKKAVFRHLKNGSPPPKHGVIFKHPLVLSAPWWQRGKIAKALSSKLAIASRIDFYSGNLNDKIAEDLDIAIDQIKASHKNPPKNKIPHTKKS